MNSTALSRRRLLVFGGAAGLLAGTALAGWSRRSAAVTATGAVYEVTHSQEEWRKLLSPAAYRVLREQGTEAPGSSPLDGEERTGLYLCAGCDLPVYSSKTKFHSGTGWPSFWEPLPNAVGTSEDSSFFMTRTEVHCRRCGGHLGHVFDDGPPPTGMRYCMNGVALNFVPGADMPGVAS
jgi:peptide-methionine (R)-S-oxide reductase